MQVSRLAQLKALLFVLCLLPLARLVLFGLTDRLGANPIEFITRSTGTWTLVMLCATLCVTPLRKLSGWSWLLRLRRMLGLFCFFYVLLHLMTWIWFDHFFDINDLVKDVIKRPFITVGFLAMLLLWPLALTSNNAAMKKLGRNWSRLHRLIYPIAGLAILHFWWMKAGKNNFSDPLWYGAFIAALLAWRVWDRWKAQPRVDSLANKSSSASR